MGSIKTLVTYNIIFGDMLFQLLHHTEDNGHRRAQLVCNVSIEQLSLLHSLSLIARRTAAYKEYSPQGDDDDNKHQGNDNRNSHHTLIGKLQLVSLNPQTAITQSCLHLIQVIGLHSRPHRVVHLTNPRLCLKGLLIVTLVEIDSKQLAKPLILIVNLRSYILCLIPFLPAYGKTSLKRILRM